MARILRPREPKPPRETRRVYKRMTETDAEARGARRGGSVSKTEKTRDTTLEDTEHDKVRLGDFVVRVRGAGGRALYLPSAVGLPGKRFRIEDVDGNASTEDPPGTPWTITLTPTGGQTISGAATKTITADYGTLLVRSDGRNWIEE